MLKSQALKHFKGNVSALARAAGATRTLIYSWRRKVPELYARRLHDNTAGALVFNPAEYPPSN